MKANKSHSIPITKEMEQHLQCALPANGPYVFGPFRNWDTAINQIRAKLPHFPHWSLHSLRRTASTKMHQLGTLPHIVEHILHHSPPKMNAIYNRYNYFEETKAALQQYNTWLSKLWATSR